MKFPNEGYWQKWLAKVPDYGHFYEIAKTGKGAQLLCCAYQLQLTSCITHFWVTNLEYVYLQ